MDSKRLPKALLTDLEKIADVTRDDQQAIVCLVGEDIHGRPGIAASVFNTIAEAGVNIRMISQGASEINISFVVKESDVPQAVRFLHRKFFTGGAAMAAAASESGNGKRSRFAAKPNGKPAKATRRSQATTL
jgi:predicted amino acid-binding ACT domain protein